MIKDNQPKSFLLQEEIDAIHTISDELHKLFNTWKGSLLKAVVEETPYLEVQLQNRDIVSTRIQIFRQQLKTKIRSTCENAFKKFEKYDGIIIGNYIKIFSSIFYSCYGSNTYTPAGPCLHAINDNKDIEVMFGTRTGGSYPFPSNIELIPKKFIKFKQIKKYLTNYYTKLFQFYFLSDPSKIQLKILIPFADDFLKYRKDTITINQLEDEFPEIKGTF